MMVVILKASEEEGSFIKMEQRSKFELRDWFISLWYSGGGGCSGSIIDVLVVVAAAVLLVLSVVVSVLIV